MKVPRWLPYGGIVAFYVTAIVVLRLIWLQPLYTQRKVPENVLQLRKWSAVNERVVRENEKLRKLAVRDSVEKVIPRTPGTYIDFPQLVQFVSAHDSSALESVRTVVSREVGDRPKVSVGLIALPFGYGGRQEIRDGQWRRLHLTGRVSGQPYCVATVPTFGGASRPEIRIATQTGVMGICRFWSRYGAPGQGIQNWLDAGGDHFAGSEESESSTGLTETMMLPEELRRSPRFMLPLAGQACLFGKKDVCAAAVAEPRRLYGVPDTSVHISEWDTRIAHGERRLLMLLERNFGRERFQQFWSSQEPFEKAFHNAFGVELGQWVYDQLKPRREVERGAHLGGSSIFLSFLFLGICVGAVLATAQRRRV